MTENSGAGNETKNLEHLEYLRDIHIAIDYKAKPYGYHFLTLDVNSVMYSARIDYNNSDKTLCRTLNNILVDKITSISESRYLASTLQVKDEGTYENPSLLIKWCFVETLDHPEQIQNMDALIVELMTQITDDSKEEGLRPYYVAGEHYGDWNMECDDFQEAQDSANRLLDEFQNETAFIWDDTGVLIETQSLSVPVNLLKKGSIVHLRDNVLETIKDRDSKVAYNGYAKVESIDDDVVTVLCLYGSNITQGKAWIAHPVRYKVTGNKWVLSHKSYR